MDDHAFMAKVAPLIYDQLWHFNLPRQAQTARWVGRKRTCILDFVLAYVLDVRGWGSAVP